MTDLDRKTILNLGELEFANWIEKNFIEGMSKVQICSFFNKVFDEIEKINHTLYFSSIAKSTGDVSKNSNLHGFLFEKFHVYTFNAKAILAHKNFRAYVLPIDGGGYGKNSVDISIRELGTNKVLKNYQAKCCQDARTTVSKLLDGDYRNQRILVCKNQVDDVKKHFSRARTVVDSIEYGGISSKPQKYSEMKALQNAIQSGDFANINMDLFSSKEIILVGLEVLGKTVALDTIYRFAVVLIHQSMGISDISFKQEISENVKEIGWDTVRNALTEGIVIEAGKNSDLLKFFPKNQLTSMAFELANIMVVTIRTGYEYSTGSLTEVEACAKMIRCVIIEACTITGSIVAGQFSGGSLAVVGSILGKVCGEGIVNVIGEENLKKAAEGCVNIINDINNIVVNPIKNNREVIQKNVLLEGEKVWE